jgi:hypothetical protein
VIFKIIVMKVFMFSLLLLATSFSYAQVGIGTTTPSNAAMLEISGVTTAGAYKGFIPPRVATTANQASIAPTTTDIGLMVFVEETGCLDFWTGTAWESIYCSGGPSDIWINEFHYTNSGTDVNQFIEIAGPAGLDISGYYLVRYRADTGQPYAAILTLSGTIDDEENGFGAISVDASNLRNDNSGFALVGPDGKVIQFLSYEGTITATGGPANGLTSINVGVVENTSTTATQSIHLTGSGNSFIDFAWSTSAAGQSTAGVKNVGQTFN